MFLHKKLIFLHYTFRALGQNKTKINLQVLDKGENCVLSLESKQFSVMQGVHKSEFFTSKQRKLSNIEQ